MNKEDLLNMIPDAERIKDSLEKNLKKQSLKIVSKNGLVSVTINYQQELTDITIDNRLLDPGKSKVLKATLIEVTNQAITRARKKMLEEAARAINLF
ncbi:MAG: YbaB/EbfC family nucleoid-associated protein [Syntrophomonadaceae bacterium]|nr:YbaB/EbfC family nucleoid-associated protein [Syntrophomonadaceae bacterium]